MANNIKHCCVTLQNKRRIEKSGILSDLAVSEKFLDTHEDIRRRKNEVVIQNEIKKKNNNLHNLADSSSLELVILEGWGMVRLIKQ